MFPSFSQFDAELTVRLNDVPVPADLLVRLRVIPVDADADLDTALNELAVPSGLSGRLLATTRDHRRWPSPLRQAVAAVVVFTVSLAYAASVVAFVSAHFEQSPSVGELQRTLAAELDPTESLVEQASSEVEAPLIELDSFASDQPASLETVAGMAPHFLVAFSSALPLWSLDESDWLPIERPAVRLAENAAFDARSWRQTGILPWFEAVREPYLDVPLVRDGAGYQLFRSELAAGRLLPESAIRVEDFLAGIDYGLAGTEVVKPTIRMFAAPSPFSPLAGGTEDGERWLVMLSVVLPAASDEPQHVRLAIQFAPEKVLAWRIIGYGPPHHGGTASQRSGEEEEFSVSMGKSAIVLCEVQTAGDDPKAELARVVLKTDDERSPNHHPSALNAAATLRCESFTSDVDAAPIAWQQAALVALTAEHLAGSPFAQDVSLAEIAAQARQIESLVCDRNGWREFIEMLVMAQTARSSLLRAF